jgi:HSP20 family protein
MLPRINTGFDFPDILDRFFNDNYVRNKNALNDYTVPAVNVSEDEKQYEVDVAAPGMEKKDFNIDVTDNMLTISAEKEHEDKQEEENYVRREFGYTQFKRTFALPDNVNEEKIDANYKDGVLKIAIPKKEIEKAKAQRKIDVK